MTLMLPLTGRLRIPLTINGGKTNWVLDADIRGFFDHIRHEWLVKFLLPPILFPTVPQNKNAVEKK